MSRPLASGAYRKLRSPSPSRPVRTIAVSDFSGLINSACALAKAAASAATDSLDRCMGRLHRQHIKAHCSGSRASRSHPVPDRFRGVLWHQRLELAIDALVVEKSLPGVAEECRELRPR